MTTGKILHYRIVKDGPNWNTKWWMVNGIGYHSLEEVRKSYPGRRLKRIKTRPLYG